MACHTSVYLVLFLPLSLLAYQITPQKKRWITLLTCNYLFFWLISGKLVLYLIGTTLFVHYIGVWLTWTRVQCKQTVSGMTKAESTEIRKKYKKREKIILAAGITGLLSILIYLKYYNFFVTNINHFLSVTGSDFSLKSETFLIPIGISFYTLQAIGYMTDVYWKKEEVYHHPGKIALFLSFFPQIMEGPISLYGQTAENLWSGNSLKSENLADGIIRIFWGLFKKIIIADRLYLLVQEIFGHSENYYGIMVVIGAIAYTVQLYMEFSGCMDIILGSGKMFGITLPENFRQPFFSKNAAEFWRRWHITLGVWFKTYMFYPVSVSAIVKKWNKFGRKHLNKYITKLGVSAMALFPVWLCNGLWHGARWSYIFYGMYYFVILMFGIAVEPLREKIINFFHINEHAVWFRILQMLKTWVIIFTGEMFFRAESLTTGMRMFKSIFVGTGIWQILDGKLVSCGLDVADYGAVIGGCIVVFIVSIVKEKQLLGQNGVKQLAIVPRWVLYYGLIFAVLIFGAYGIGYQQVDMIYAGF